MRKLFHISYLEHKTNHWVWSKINFLVDPQEPLLPRDGNLHSFGMSHAMTASPNPSFGAPWTVSDTAVGRGNAGWTASKSGHACLCQNCSQRPPAENTGREPLLSCPSCSPNDPISQGTELNQTTVPVDYLLLMYFCIMWCEHLIYLLHIIIL